MPPIVNLRLRHATEWTPIPFLRRSCSSCDRGSRSTGADLLASRSERDTGNMAELKMQARRLGRRLRRPQGGGPGEHRRPGLSRSPDQGDRDHKAARTSDLGTDKPGTVHQSVGDAECGRADRLARPRRGGFLKELAARLDKAIVEQRCHRTCRRRPASGARHDPQGLSPAVREALIAEIDKDLASHPVHDIEKHLLDAQ